MANQIQEKKNNLPAEINNPSAWGAPQMSSQDITLPRLMVMQGLSEMVIEKKAAIGDFVDSLSGKVIGNISNSPLVFVPFHMEIIWYKYHFNNKEKEFELISKHPLCTDPTSKDYNDKWQNEEVVKIDGKDVEVKRERRYFFYAIDCAEPNGLPLVLLFKVTSASTGKKLATQMYVKNVQAGKTPAHRAFKFTGKQESNAKGDFVVPTIEEFRDSTPAELASAFKWFKTVTAGAVKVDQAEDEKPLAKQKVEPINEKTAEY